MLGIIFTGGQAPNASFVKQIIEKEAKNAFFTAADSGLSAAQEAGVKCDFIIGDMDSVEDSLLEEYPAEKVIRHAREKDYSDTELAMQAIIEKGCTQIWIIGGGGGRIDHLFAIRSLFEREIFPVRWLTGREDIRCIEAESANKYVNLNFPRGITVSVFPLSQGTWEADSRGLKWTLCGLSWDRGFYGLSNVTLEDEFSITAVKGRFMIILPHVCKKEELCQP